MTSISVDDVPSHSSGEQVGTGDKLGLCTGHHNLWRVGHTTNIMQRLKAINQHIPVELGVVERKGELLQKWLDAVMAYAMEQRVFEILGCGANRM